MNTTTHNSHPESDREALSALFDGELVGDAARFALKRLDHDQAWRDSCERWQRIGDALRGQGAMLPTAFPERVRDALRAEAMGAAAIPAIPAQQARRAQFRWGSVGLAASAALVAFFLARMPMNSSGDDATTQVAAATQPAQAPAQQTPGTPDPALQQATAAVAAVAAARPVSERIAQRSRNVERGRKATDRVVSTAVAADAAPVTGEVAQPVRMVVNGEPTPSTPQVVLDAPAQTAMGGALVSAESARPWPRAVLPQLGGSGALAADYTSAPSFYPFTPRPTLEPADEAANDDDGATPTQP
jgi:Meckel syndrome type 1 protein